MKNLIIIVFLFLMPSKQVFSQTITDRIKKDVQQISSLCPPSRLAEGLRATLVTAVKESFSSSEQPIDESAIRVNFNKISKSDRLNDSIVNTENDAGEYRHEAVVHFAFTTNFKSPTGTDFLIENTLNKNYRELEDPKSNSPLLIVQVRLKSIFDDEGNFLKKICLLDSTPELSFQRDEPFEYWSESQGRWVRDDYDEEDLSIRVVNRSTNKLVEKLTNQVSKFWPKFIKVEAKK